MSRRSGAVQGKCMDRPFLSSFTTLFRRFLRADATTTLYDVLTRERVPNSAQESLLFKNEQHTGPVRGLDFNPIQGNLFASGAVNAEVRVTFLCHRQDYLLKGNTLLSPCPFIY